MTIKYFVDKSLIPNDSSFEIINKFTTNLKDKNAEILIYPDVHYKKGARTVNGILLASSDYIYPSLLGTANCGFTFGKLKNTNANDLELLKQSFHEYSLKLKDYGQFSNYSDKFIENLFHEYLCKDFYENQNLYNFLNVKSSEELCLLSKKILTPNILELAKNSLGSLGGGNHFFELHYIEETFENNGQLNTGDVIYILHSDSIAVGEWINLIFSNLSEWDFLFKDKITSRRKFFKHLKNRIKWARFRIKQLQYFTFTNNLLLKDPLRILNLIFSQNDNRRIKADSPTGKSILFAFNIASLFGEINRDIILNNYSSIVKKYKNEIELSKLGSHSHDSLIVEKQDNNIKFVSRNGVQKIGNDDLFILPGALGTETYIIKNTFNEEAFYSANHGVGRLQDKHIAKKFYSENQTENKLKESGLSLYRVGKGNIAEQNFLAFKDICEVIKVMESYNLGLKTAKTLPFAAVKG